MAARSSPLILVFMGLWAAGSAAQTMSRADSLAQLGDTTRAIAVYEALLKKSRRDAEAHYRVGRLYWALALDDGAVSADRRAAEEHLRYATRFEPDSAKYWLGLAEVFRRATEASMRVQWGRTLRRARETALTSESPLLGLAEYWAGRMKWEEYERHGRRWQFQVGQPGQLPAANGPDAWRDMKNLLETSLRPLPDSWEGTYGEAVDHLRAAVAAAPDYVPAVALLAIALGDEDGWEEALEATRRMVRVAPDSARGWMVHGMVLARMGRFEEAEAAQRRGLALMDDSARASYEDLAHILPRRDRDRWQGATDAERTADGALYWSVAQPLLVTGINEVHAEFLARLTYVDFRWSEPFGGRGWETDRGSVYLRWGPPEQWGTLRDNYTVWVYPGLRLFFAFEGRSGYTYARFAGEHQFVYEDLSNSHPVSFRNVPALHRIDSAVVQVAQFRGPRTDSTELAVFGFVPVGRLTRVTARQTIGITMGAYVRNERFAPIAEQTVDERVTVTDTAQFEHRSWRFMVSPGERVVRVEAIASELGRAARSQQPLRVRHFGTDSLQLSDVLIARRLEPRDSAFESWRDFLIEPSAGVLKPGERLGLLWESYNLTPDSTGVARFAVEVSVRVEELIRGRGLHAQIVGGVLDAVGLSARGDERLALAYEAEAAVMPHGRHVDYLVVDFDRVPNATYEVRVTVTDLATGQEATARRRFAVDPADPGAR